MKHTSIFISSIFLLVLGSSVSAATFDDVLEYTPDRQAQYLSKPGQDFEISCFQDKEGCINLLVSIAESNSSSSELAMYFLNSLILVLTSSGNFNAHSGLLNAGSLEDRLTKLILDKSISIEVRNGAIVAHSTLFPPRDEILQFFKTQIIGATDYRDGFVYSALTALEKYESRDGVPIPKYLLTELPALVNNQSDSVTNQAIKMLFNRKGKDYLPDLFSHLETGKHGTSTNRLLVHYILKLDDSEATISKLEAIPQAARWVPQEK